MKKLTTCKPRSIFDNLSIVERVELLDDCLAGAGGHYVIATLSEPVQDR